jgi:uncharacterized cupredoxin-like copper-binding protein
VDRVTTPWRRRSLAAAFGAAALLLAAGCGGTQGLGPADATLVTVNERDFSISASPNTVDAGTVLFQDENHGPDAHELIVVRDDTGDLPLRSDGLTVSEEKLAHSIVGALEPGMPGTVRQLKLKLAPGRYVLICNMEGHYMGGMHTVLVVR